MLQALPRSPSLQQVPAGAAAAMPGLKRSSSSALNGDEPTPHDRGRTAGLSPAASLGTLQSGTVQASAADFAAAAAAAAAALAAAAAGLDEEHSPGTASSSSTAAARSSAAAPPEAAAGAVGSAMSAAQASVSALRGSSWVWGRRLQGLLRATSAGGPSDIPVAAAAAADAVDPGGASHHTVEMPLAGAAGTRSSSRASARSPEPVLPAALGVPGRVAVSIYAYAGNPQPVGSSAEEAPHRGPDLEGIVVEPVGQLHPAHQQQQQLVGQNGSLGLGWFAGAAGSSSTAAILGVPAAASSSNDMGVHVHQQVAAVNDEAGTPASRSFSLPGATS